MTWRLAKATTFPVPAPLVAKVTAPVPKAAPLLIANVPPLIVVPPVWVLAAVRVSVPVPILFTALTEPVPAPTKLPE